MATLASAASELPCVDIPGLLARAAAIRPDAAALHAPGGPTISAVEMQSRVLAAAADLHRHGVRGGAAAGRVALVLPNGPDLALAMLAAASAGTAVPLNPAYRREEYETYFRLAGRLPAGRRGRTGRRRRRRGGRHSRAALGS